MGQSPKLNFRDSFKNLEELKNQRIINDLKNVRNNVLMYPTLNG